eukprot:TRINITY_DN9669_c0_g2_i1.p1 TRINITY_DN9669_c0_g2~~TRINITY_DN9669_c0_g2_i1.p1  ORF type:complete len:345 (-),score=102.51 TRINITY_DN9669_c0_g2_i1:18-1052(-)
MSSSPLDILHPRPPSSFRDVASESPSSSFSFSSLGAVSSLSWADQVELEEEMNRIAAQKDHQNNDSQVPVSNNAKRRKTWAKKIENDRARRVTLYDLTYPGDGDEGDVQKRKQLHDLRYLRLCSIMSHYGRLISLELSEDMISSLLHHPYHHLSSSLPASSVSSTSSTSTSSFSSSTSSSLSSSFIFDDMEDINDNDDATSSPHDSSIPTSVSTTVRTFRCVVMYESDKAAKRAASDMNVRFHRVTLCKKALRDSSSLDDALFADMPVRSMVPFPSFKSHYHPCSSSSSTSSSSSPSSSRSQHKNKKNKVKKTESLSSSTSVCSPLSSSPSHPSSLSSSPPPPR